MSDHQKSVGDFDGKSAVVTGAGSGIGKAAVEILLGRGAKVLAVDLKTTAAFEQLGHAGARLLTSDVTNEEQRRLLVEAAEGSDFLVNSAGVIRLPPIGVAGERDWNVVFEVNAKAVFFLCQQLGSRLLPGGAIVNLSSLAARNPANTETAIYAASKAAVLSITRSFAHAYSGRDVRVNAVVPGMIDTPMQEFVIDTISGARAVDRATLSTQRNAWVPMGRMGTARETAEVIVWLLSPASSYLTGQAIAVDGGASML